MRGKKMLECIHRRFPVAADAEITLEVNPGTVDKNTLGALRKIGIQPFECRRAVLRRRGAPFPGAHPQRGNGQGACFTRRERWGFDNLSLDLMLGAAAQSEASFQRDLDEITSLKPDHASVYMLTVEDGTPFGQRRAGGQDPALDDDLLATPLRRASAQRLPDMGLLQYEISNFATEGRHSRHNLSYWNGSPYLGLGPAAHSFRYESNGQTALREANPEDLDAYLTHNFGQSPFAEVEAIDRETLAQGNDFLRTAHPLGPSTSPPSPPGTDKTCAEPTPRRWNTWRNWAFLRSMKPAFAPPSGAFASPTPSPWSFSDRLSKRGTSLPAPHLHPFRPQTSPGKIVYLPPSTRFITIPTWEDHLSTYPSTSTKRGVSVVFQGFSESAFHFFRQLAEHNDKLWFDEHKGEYESLILEPSRAFVSEMGEKLQTLAPKVVADPRVNQSLFRLNRDTPLQQGQASL